MTKIGTKRTHTYKEKVAHDKETVAHCGQRLEYTPTKKLQNKKKREKRKHTKWKR